VPPLAYGGNKIVGIYANSVYLCTERLVKCEFVYANRALSDTNEFNEANQIGVK